MLVSNVIIVFSKNARRSLQQTLQQLGAQRLLDFLMGRPEKLVGRLVRSLDDGAYGRSIFLTGVMEFLAFRILR
jgi:hypothetical protein